MSCQLVCGTATGCQLQSGNGLADATDANASVAWVYLLALNCEVSENVLAIFQVDRLFITWEQCSCSAGYCSTHSSPQHGQQCIHI